MDSELQSLMQRFQQLQKQDVVHRINERNIIEILNVIHKEKHLVDVLYTSDGKEFVTWDQLRREIIDEVYANHGRMNIVDLPSALGVDLAYVERALPQLYEEQGSNLITVMGELITSEYLEALVLDAAEQLKESGSLNVSQFAKSYHLTSMFVSDILAAAVANKKLFAQSTDMALYTPVYVHAQRIALRSALLARSTPTAIYDLAVRRGIDLGLLPILLGQLATILPGTIDGGAAGQYTPFSFTQSRKEQVLNVYGSNGYITYTAVQSLGISNAKRYLEATMNPPAVLSPVAQGAPVPRGGRKGKRAAASESSATDASTGVVRASEDFPMAGYALQNCFLSDKLLQGLHVLDDSDELKLIDLGDVLPDSVNFEQDMECLMPRLQELFPAVKKCTLVGASTLFDHHRWWADLAPKIIDLIGEEVCAPKKVGASEGKPAKGSKPPAAAEERATFDPSTNSKLLQFLAKSLSFSLEDKRQELLDIVRVWDEPLHSAKLAAMQSVAEKLHGESKKKKMEVQAQCTEMWAESCVLSKGLEWVCKEVPSVFAAMERAHLQGPGLALIKLVLINEALHHDQKLGEKVRALCDGGNAIRSAVGCFDKKKQESLNALTEAVNGPLSKLMETLEGLCSSGDIVMSSFHSLNKKAERELSSSMRQFIHNQVESSKFSGDPQSSANVFALCCSALVAAKFRVVLHIPGKAVAGICSRLQKEFSQEEPLHGGLARAKEIIVGSLVGTETLSENICGELESFRALVLQEACGMGSPVASSA